MKTTSRFTLTGIVLFALAALLLTTSCASRKRVDWDARVGSYTYDQAVADMGPPDKQATLTDGRTMAEWVEHRSGSGVSIGTGVGFGNVGLGVGHSVGSGRNRSLKLTFNKEGRLANWAKD